MLCIQKSFAEKSCTQKYNTQGKICFFHFVEMKYFLEWALKTIVLSSISYSLNLFKLKESFPIWAFTLLVSIQQKFGAKPLEKNSVKHK